MSYESILTCCEEIRSDWKHLDCLVLNAGIMGKEFEVFLLSNYILSFYSSPPMELNLILLQICLVIML